jgi:AraC-like DNA-binding protein
MLRAGTSLSEIAHDTGFSDQPHLCRAFRRETGVTPSEFRELASVEQLSARRSR